MFNSLGTVWCCWRTHYSSNLSTYAVTLRSLQKKSKSATFKKNLQSLGSIALISNQCISVQGRSLDQFRLNNTTGRRDV